MAPRCSGFSGSSSAGGEMALELVIDLRRDRGVRAGSAVVGGHGHRRREPGRPRISRRACAGGQPDTCPSRRTTTSSSASAPPTSRRSTGIRPPPRRLDRNAAVPRSGAGRSVLRRIRARLAGSPRLPRSGPAGSTPATSPSQADVQHVLDGMVDPLAAQGLWLRTGPRATAWLPRPGLWLGRTRCRPAPPAALRAAVRG